MSDYDIVISLNPSQPVQGAQKVTEAVAKIEVQSKETQKALDAVTLDVSKAQQAQAAASTQQLAKFKQVTASAAAAWGVLSSKFELTQTAVGQVVDSAVKFGAIGAQVAGPWGAAIGAIGGALLDLGDKLDDTAGGFHILTDAVIAHEAAMHKAMVIVPGFEKVLADLNITVRKLQGGFFETQEQLGNVEFWLDDTAKIVKKANAEIAAANSVWASWGTTLGKVSLGLTDVIEKGARVGLGLGWGKEVKFKTPGEKIDTRAPSYAIQPTAPHVAYMGLGERADSEYRDEYGRGIDLAKAAEQSLHDRLDGTKAWNAELDKAFAKLQDIRRMDDVITDQFKSMATTLSDTFVDAANGADVSWRSVLKGILVGFEKAIAQALVLRALTGDIGGAKGIGGHYGGLFGLLGFASGGVISPSGSGTTDTQTVMFRKAPSETVRIHTPGQEAAYTRGGSSQPVTVQVVDNRSDRALAPSRADKQVFVELARQNQGFLRSITR